jgi:triosephosphate isomerase
MNPATTSDALRIFSNLSKKMMRPKCEVVIAPSALHLTSLRSLIKKPYVLGAQNAHPKDGGPHTGNVSARMLYAAGVRAVIIGHSELRAEGESDTQVNEKVRALLALSIAPIICVGETVRDTHGKYYGTVELQLRHALQGVKKSEVEKVVVAYEPVWAISGGDGMGQTATPHDAHEMKLFIQKVLVELYGRAIAMRVRVLYGGSVNDTNAEVLMREGEVDGFLVGGASLKPEQFAKIISVVTSL